MLISIGGKVYCDLHRKYCGESPPRTACRSCWQIFTSVQQEKSVKLKEGQDGGRATSGSSSE